MIDRRPLLGGRLLLGRFIPFGLAFRLRRGGSLVSTTGQLLLLVVFLVVLVVLLDLLFGHGFQFPIEERLVFRFEVFDRHLLGLAEAGIRRARIVGLGLVLIEKGLQGRVARIGGVVHELGYRHRQPLDLHLAIESLKTVPPLGRRHAPQAETEHPSQPHRQEFLT